MSTDISLLFNFAMSSEEGMLILLFTHFSSTLYIPPRQYVNKFRRKGG